MRAAHTEVKTTLANIHSAQALHMTDENVYTETLGSSGLGLELPDPANTNSSNFTYGSAAVSGHATAATATTATNGDNKAHVVDDVQYRVVATARRKLAGCATPVTSGQILDTWCLNDNKLITNDKTLSDPDNFSDSGTTARCKDNTNDAIGTGC